MAKGKSSDKVNKSQAIREYKEANPSAGPTAIAAALSEQGLNVTAGMVSTVLSTAKRKGKGKRRGPKGRPGRKPGAAAATSDNSAKLSVDTLVRAKKLADQLGGIAKARQALEALSLLTK